MTKLQLIRLGFQALGPIAPAAAGRLAERLWLGTHRSPVPEWERQVLGDPRVEHIRVEGNTVVTYRWGSGDNVLLAHGWNGRTGQLGGFVAPLTERGYRVIGFDAPGHGQSSGNRTSILQFTQVMQEIVARHGPLRAVLGHSFGGMCAAFAMDAGLPAERAVCVASPSSMAWLMRRFARYLELPAPVLRDLQRRAEQRIGKGNWQRLANGEQASNLEQPALIVHDRNDDVVPWRQGRDFAESWPGARFVCTRGLGHRRILRDPAVVQEVVRFIVDEPEPVSRFNPVNTDVET